MWFSDRKKENREEKFYWINRDKHILFACFFVLAITISKAVIYFDKNFLLFPSFWISDVFNLYFNLLFQSAMVLCPKCNQNFENRKVFGGTFIIFVMSGYLDLRSIYCSAWCRYWSKKSFVVKCRKN